MGDYLGKRFDVRVERDVKYAVGGVDFTKGLRYRDLKLDVYSPVGDAGGARPALILAFGGAFHRGSKETDEFGDAEGYSTPVAEYCRLFAARGYVCFCIDYRLTQEDCEGGVTPVLDPAEPMNKDRVNVVRGMLGLPPATDDELARGIEAATDDMVHAIGFVRSRSRHYGVDIHRIAIGGFSAGAVISLAAAFVERAPVAAVISLSGRLSETARRTCVTGAADEPAVLMFVGDRDLPVMAEAAPPMAARFEEVGARYRLERLANSTHFYPKTTPTSGGADVETTMASFLKEALRLG
ncbi:MAG: dienelactone hydrolase family protein [Rhodoblastus sp.]